MFKSEKGAVAIEALFSLMLLFATIYAMWGVSLVIFNQTKLNTATQLSSQAGLLTVNRTSYRNPTSLNAALRSRWAAEAVFKENLCGMMAGQFTTGVPARDTCRSGITGINANPMPGPNTNFGTGEAGFNYFIECAQNISTSFSASNCGNPAANRAVQFRVESAVYSPFSLMGFFSSSTSSRPKLHSNSAVFSYTP